MLFGYPSCLENIFLIIIITITGRLILSLAFAKKNKLYVWRSLQISFVCYTFLRCLYKQICSEKTFFSWSQLWDFLFPVTRLGRAGVQRHGDSWARPWEVWSVPGRGQPGVHGGLCSSASSFVDKMYERHKRRYSLCDISKVDRTVDVVLLKVWCLWTLIYGFLSPSPMGRSVPHCTRSLSWRGSGWKVLSDHIVLNIIIPATR